MSAPVQVVLIGHLGFAQDDTPYGSTVGLGGSGYAAARGATAAVSTTTGIIARVGPDFDLAALRRLGLDLTGVQIVAGPSARLHITQDAHDRRTFRSELGVARTVQVDTFPDRYAGARFVHLATMPPPQQRQWLDAVRKVSPDSVVSVDMFEPTAADDPDGCRELCRDADMVFLNWEEYRLLFGGRPAPDVPMILKAGPGGATYRAATATEHAPAPAVAAIDTTGAGELLAGAFLALVAAGVPRAAALRHAVGIASAKVAEFGVDGPLVSAELDRVRARIAESGWRPAGRTLGRVTPRTS